LQAFGGVPLLLNLDNLKAAVLKADWLDPEINPKLGWPPCSITSIERCQPSVVGLIT
jgi:hypothetical protein